MLFTTDFSELKKWMPLVMEGRNEFDKVAGTTMAIGTDVNFGELTRNMFSFLSKMDGVTMFFNHEVKKLKQSISNIIILPSMLVLQTSNGKSNQFIIS